MLEDFNNLRKFKNIKRNSVEYLKLRKESLKIRMNNGFYHPFQVKNRQVTRSVIEVQKSNRKGYDKNMCITVAICTHNRTNVACAVIDSLIKNIKYKNLKWCITDDRSENNHIDRLVKRFYKNNIYDVTILKTNPEKYGLGASLNNALKYAWKNGDLVLTVEDDWILERSLDLEYYSKILQEDCNLSMIRLAYLDDRHEVTEYNEKLYCIGQSKYNYIFNNQCALRHKRIYDFLGYYKENCNSDEQEEDFKNRYNNKTFYGKYYKVLFPKDVKPGTFDDKSLYFIHVGRSTNGHSWYDVPERYNWIYEDKWIMEIQYKNPYPIVLITDKNYTDNVCKMIRQIRKYSDTPIYILCWDKETYNNFQDDYNNVKYLVINSEQQQRCIDAAGDLSHKKGYFVPPVGLIKFLIPEILSDINTILYMDCDILITKAFGELLYKDINNKICGVVKDPYKIVKDTSLYPVMNELEGYFNSGVLLMNLDMMRKEKLTDKLFEVKKSLKKKNLMDQDTLNICMNGNVDFLDNRYNSLLPIIYKLLNEGEIKISQINKFYGKSYRNYNDIKLDSIFIHYAGGLFKPWLNKENIEWNSI